MEAVSMGFPQGMVRAYAEGRIRREEFIAAFSGWQKSRGTSYDCRCTAAGGVARVCYRGVTATVTDGQLWWSAGVWQDRRGREHQDMRSAGTVAEFRRMVDFALRREWLEGGGRCLELMP